MTPMLVSMSRWPVESWACRGRATTTGTAGHHQPGGEANTLLLKQIAEIHEQSRGTYGWPPGEVEERGKPFDLIVYGFGPVRHVEVKGSTMPLAAVELTAKEVAHASNHQPTDLFVVDKIEADIGDGGSVSTFGGRQRVWENWVPSESTLSPTRYTHPPPTRVGPNTRNHVERERFRCRCPR